MDALYRLQTIKYRIEPAIESISQSVWLRSQLRNLPDGEIEWLADQVRGSDPEISLELIVSSIFKIAHEPCPDWQLSGQITSPGECEEDFVDRIGLPVQTATACRKPEGEARK